MEKADYIMAGYVLAVLVFLTYTLNPGVWITDEAIYTLMVKSLVVDGHFYIENGLNEDRFITLLTPLSGISTEDGEYRVYGQYPPLYTITAAPFYGFLGLYGLHLLNVLSYCMVVFFAYGLFTLFFEKKKAVLITVIYSLTYVFAYNQMIWPHMLSTMLVTLSALLLFRQGITKKHVKASLLLTGFFSAWAIGVRYPNGLYALIAVTYVYFTDKKNLKYLLGGMVMPAILLAGLHYNFYGSIFEAGYYQHEYDEGMSFIYLPIGLAILYLAYRKGLIKKRQVNLRNIVTVFLLLILIGLFFEPTRTKILQFFCRVFNMAYFPGKEGFKKKALFQSIPYLTLIFFGWKTMWKKTGKKLALTISAYALAILFFTPFMPFSGEDETQTLRYLIDSLPFLTMVAAYAVEEIYQKNRFCWKEFTITFLAAIYFLYTAGIFYQTHPYYSLAWIIYTSIFAIAYLILCRRIDLRRVFTVILALAVAYSFNVSIVSFKAMHIHRMESYGAGTYIAQSIENRSVIIYPEDYNLPILVYSKLEKDTRLMFTKMDMGQSLNKSIEYYSKNKYNIYLTKVATNDWFENVTKYVNSRNITGIRYVEITIKQ
ncbi:MAG: hypothetical protein KKD39_03130 [Candidatus Altiarchaeota archaeon]|nr:hypothetical protein [Candidatus Altiarchaeota archaeon]